jgi:hypothetical protein
MSTDGEVANALVCKTSIHGFKSHSVLQSFEVLSAKRQDPRFYTVAENVATARLYPVRRPLLLHRGRYLGCCPLGVSYLLGSDVPLHFVHRLRLMLLSGMSVPDNY